MLKIFLKNKTIEEEQQQFFFCLEKIVNISLVKTERNENNSVKNILNDLKQIFLNLLQLRKDNPDKFDSLFWSKTFFDKYIVPISQQKKPDKDDSINLQNTDNLKQEASLLLSFFPEEEMKGLTLFINSFKKIWKSAFLNNNNEICEHVAFQLEFLLNEMAQEPKNNLLIEQFLRLLFSITYEAIEEIKLRKRLNPSVYTVSIFWYPNIVFNEIDQFDISYLDLFNKYFFRSIKFIISEGQTKLFRAFVSHLIDLNIPLYNSTEIDNYGRSIDYTDYEILNKNNTIDDNRNKLYLQSKDINTKEQLDKWLNEFTEIKHILEPIFNDENKETEKLTEQRIREYVVTQYKFNNLLEFIFAICAYCLFKQKPEYIKYIWEYEQPIDSDANWVGNEIIPENINEITNFYFKKNLFDKQFGFGEGHHGSTIYYKKYFLLRLAKILETFKPNSEGKYEKIENYSIPNFDVYTLANMEYSIDELNKIASELYKETKLLYELGFNKEKSEETFYNKLIPLLNILKDKSKQKISEIETALTINIRQVEQFKERVLKEFNASTILRSIFKYLNLYENKSDEEYKGKLERFGINRLYDKAAFFEKWYVDYDDIGDRFGENLAYLENSYIMTTLINQCQTIDKFNLDNISEYFDNLSNVIIFTTINGLAKHLETSNSYKPKWHKDAPKQLNIDAFVGWYNHKIPIFKIHDKKYELMILDKEKLGKLIQHSPLNTVNEEGLKKDIFYMNIQAFSENKDLLTKFLDNPPDGLKDIGEKNKQEEYLEKKVLINIFERYEFKKHTEFKGYLLKSKL